MFSKVWGQESALKKNMSHKKIDHVVFLQLHEFQCNHNIQAKHINQAHNLQIGPSYFHFIHPADDVEHLLEDSLKGKVLV